MTKSQLQKLAILIVALQFFPFILLSGGVHYVGMSTYCAPPELIICRGNIALVGNNPHTTLIINYIDSESRLQKEYALTGESVMLLENYQQERLEVVGSIKSPEIGPGFPAVLEVLYFRKPDGTWMDSAGEDVEVPEEIITDGQILRYFASKEKNNSIPVQDISP